MHTTNKNNTSSEPKKMRGIIISPPVLITHDRVNFKTTELDPIQLRMWLLYWDELVWPRRREMDRYPIGNDAECLISQGIISRPDYPVYRNPAKELPQTYVQAYQYKENKNPGCWAIAQGENAFQMMAEEITEGRDILVRLLRAVPVPAGDVPIAEILDFKERRKAELHRFRHEIEELYSNIEGRADQAMAFNLAVEKIQEACADLIQVNKEWKFGSLLSDWDFSISLKDLGALGTGFFGAQSYGLDTVASLLAGAASSAISFSPNIGKKIAENKKNPYRYAALIHKELRF